MNMKRLLAILALLTLAAPVAAQAVILDVSGAQPGKYFYQVNVQTGGIVTVQPINQVIKLTDPVPTPTPDQLTARSQRIRDAAKGVTGDSDREGTAAVLAAYYREIATKVKAGEIKGKDQIAFAIKTGCDMILTNRKAMDPWNPTRSVAAEYWTALVQEGATDADYAKLLDEVAIGLDASHNGQPQIDMAMIIQIIKLVIELIEKFFP
jgi:hypothetical protein